MSRAPVTGMRAFWIIWWGLLLSFTGSGFTRFGLSVWVYQMSRDAEAFALLLFFGILPLSLGALVAGPLVDRWDRKRVLVVATALARVPTVAVILLWWQGGLEVWHVYLAVAANGLANAFVLPAFDASIRMLVPRERLGQASGFSQLVQSLGVVVGPPLAGLLLATLGLGSIFAVDVASAVLALVALAAASIPNPGRLLDDGSSVLASFAFGLRYVVARPAFVFLAGFLALTVLGSSFVYALSGPLVLGLGDEATLGLVYAAYGIGAVAGAVAIGAWGGPARRIPGMLAAALMLGIGTALTGARADALWIGVIIAGLGAAQAVLLALNRVVFQEHAAPEVLGRVFAFRMVLTAAAQAGGIVLAGSLAERAFEPAMMPGGALEPVLGPLLGSGEGRGAALMLVIIGALMSVLTLAAIASARVRRLEDDLVAMGDGADHVHQHEADASMREQPAG